VSKARNRKLRTTHQALAAGALGCFLLACAWAATRTGSTAAQQKAVRTRPPRAAAHAASSRLTADTSRKTAGSYDVIFSRNLFRPPSSGQPAKQGALPPMPIEAFESPNASGQQAAQQAPQWVYAGYATVDGAQVAIIENAQTKRAEFLRLGDRLEGYALREITAATVRLERGADTMSLAISQAFTATPLNEPPKPTRAGTQQQGGRGRGGGPMGGLMQTDLFRNVIMPAIRDNPQYAEEARNLMRGFGGRGQMPFGGPGFFGPQPGPGNQAAQGGGGGTQ